MFPLRLATFADLPPLRELIEKSVRELSSGYYTAEQIQSALRYVLGPDSQLISDQTYFVIENSDSELIAAGGWSPRATIYGGDQMKGESNPLLNPATDAARIRAFFVHPRWSRRGFARRLFERCASEAIQSGFQALELVATLPGVPLYRALGFIEVERIENPLPDGQIIPVVRMRRSM